MAVSVPNSLALTSIEDGSTIVASDHRNNYAAVQVGVNGLVAMFTAAPTKGDLLISTGAGSFDKLAVGSNGYTLVADSAQSVGMKWFIPSGTRLAYGTKTSAVSTSGANFAGGSDLLASALNFTADGSSDYILRVHGQWASSSAGLSTVAANLDGSAAGSVTTNTQGFNQFLAAAILIAAPAAGAHTVNARIYIASGGPIATVAGSGGTGSAPTLVTIEKA